MAEPVTSQNFPNFGMFKKKIKTNELFVLNEISQGIETFELFF
jgi:hypothetical protein